MLAIHIDASSQDRLLQAAQMVVDVTDASSQLRRNLGQIRKSQDRSQLTAGTIGSRQERVCQSGEFSCQDR